MVPDEERNSVPFLVAALESPCNSYPEIRADFIVAIECIWSITIGFNSGCNLSDIVEERRQANPFGVVVMKCSIKCLQGP